VDSLSNLSETTQNNEDLHSTVAIGAAPILFIIEQQLLRRSFGR
jgi:hypothetical protein